MIPEQISEIIAWRIFGTTPGEIFWCYYIIDKIPKSVLEKVPKRIHGGNPGKK